MPIQGLESLWEKLVMNGSAVIGYVWGLDWGIDNLLFAFEYIDSNSVQALQFVYFWICIAVFLSSIDELLSESEKV